MSVAISGMSEEHHDSIDIILYLQWQRVKYIRKNKKITLYDKVHTSDKMYDVMSPDDVRRAASDNMINVNYNLL